MSQKRQPPPTDGQDPTPPPPAEGEVVRCVKVGRLDTVADWRRQIGKIYREMRKGLLATEIGTRLVYVADVGARLARIEEEIRAADALREQLAQLQGRPGGQVEGPRLLGSPIGATPEGTPEWAREEGGERQETSAHTENPVGTDL